MSKITASTAFCSLAEVLIKGRRHALLLLCGTSGTAIVPECRPAAGSTRSKQNRAAML